MDFSTFMDYKIWSSALDENCCLTCMRLHGQAVPMKSRFMLNGKPVKDPPLHKGCGCCLGYSARADMEPQLTRDVEKLEMLIDMVTTSTRVVAVERSYTVLLELADNIAVASDVEIKRAGLSVKKIRETVRKACSMRGEKDDLYEQAIQRAVDYETREAAKLKTERGRKNRMLRLRQSIMEDCQSLSMHNISYLYLLIPE